MGGGKFVRRGKRDAEDWEMADEDVRMSLSSMICLRHPRQTLSMLVEKSSRECLPCW